MTDRAHPRSTLGRLAAEMVVIVLGVLVALGVDQWNDGRKERVLEANYLEALSRDVRGDSVAYVQIFLPALAVADSALRAIAPVVRGAPLEGDTVAFLEAVSLGGRLGSPTLLTLARRTTFDELIATGKLGIIRSAPLRAALVDYYEQARIGSERLQARIPDYPMAVHAYYPAELRQEKTVDDVRAFGLRRAVEGFRSPEFEAVMNQEFNFVFMAQPSMESGVEQTNALLRLLEGGGAAP